MEHVRDLLDWRIPAGAAAFVAAACALVTWITATHLVAPTDPLFQSRPITKLSDPFSTGNKLKVTGRVARIQEFTFESAAAHILRLHDAADIEYIVFVWGTPTITVGQSVEIEGMFQRVSEPPAASTYHGIALRVRVVSSH